MTHDIADISRYSEPETIYAAKTLDVTVQQMNATMRVDGTRISKIKKGTVWATVMDKDGKVLLRERLDSDKLFTVTQLLETEESRAASRRAYANRALVKEYEKINPRKNMMAVLESLVEEVTGDDFIWRENRVTALIRTNAQTKIEIGYKSFIDDVKESGRFEDMVSAREAFDAERRKWLLDPYRHEAFSRSTSVMSNLFEDADKHALALWLSAMNYL